MGGRHGGFSGVPAGTHDISVSHDPVVPARGLAPPPANLRGASGTRFSAWFVACASVPSVLTPAAKETPRRGFRIDAGDFGIATCRRARPGTLPQSQTTAHHRRRRREQRQPGAALEGGARAVCPATPVCPAGGAVRRETRRAVSRKIKDVLGQRRLRSTMLHNRIHRYWLYLLGVPGNQNEICRVGKNNAGPPRR